MNTTSAKNKQTTGNIGLFYVCFRLSRMGWNVLPTSRNAWGPDILIYSQDAKHKFSIQVKSLAKRDPAGFGKNLEKLVEDFVIVCKDVAKPDGNPVCFILNAEEAKNLAYRDKRGGQHWLQPPAYDSDNFRERWDKIGRGD